MSRLMKGLCTMLVVVAGVHELFAQSIERPIEVVVNSELIGHVQMLSPAFFYAEDSATFNGNLRKHLLERLHRGSGREADSLRSVADLANERDRFLKLAETFFWSSKVTQLPAKAVVPDSAAVFRYYQENRHRFSSAYTFSYWQAWIEEPNDADVRAASSLLLERSKKTGADAMDKGKVTNVGFTVNHEEGLRLEPSHPLYEHLVRARPNELHGPVPIGPSAVVLVLTARSGGVPRPFNEVRDICVQEMTQQNAMLREQAMQEELLRNYKVIVAPELRGGGQSAGQ
jgi:hypothetical protein